MRSFRIRENCGHSSVNVVHGHFDEVCGRALHGGVDGLTLGVGAHRGVGVLDGRQVATPGKHCCHVPVFLAEADSVSEIPPHTGVPGVKKQP